MDMETLSVCMDMLLFNFSGKSGGVGSFSV